MTHPVSTSHDTLSEEELARFFQMLPFWMREPRYPTRAIEAAASRSLQQDQGDVLGAYQAAVAIVDGHDHPIALRKLKQIVATLTPPSPESDTPKPKGINAYLDERDDRECLACTCTEKLDTHCPRHGETPAPQEQKQEAGELVKQLRDSATFISDMITNREILPGMGKEYANLRHAAAAEIERLTEKLAEAERQTVAWRGEYRWAIGGWEGARVKIASLEQQLKTLVKERDAIREARREAYESVAKLFDHDGWLDLIRNGTLPNDVITPRTVAQVIRRLSSKGE